MKGPLLIVEKGKNPTNKKLQPPLKTTKNTLQTKPTQMKINTKSNKMEVES